MPRFDYNDTVCVVASASAWLPVPGAGPGVTRPRPGEPASVFAIDDAKDLPASAGFPPGVVYGIEYADGEAVCVHEQDLERLEDSTLSNPS